MIDYSRTARGHITALREHYEKLERPEAIRNLIRAIEEAAARIERSPEAGLPAPRPYPELKVLGWRWVKAGRYWFAYVTVTDGAVIAGVFYETADIPSRL